MRHASLYEVPPQQRGLANPTHSSGRFGVEQYSNPCFRCRFAHHGRIVSTRHGRHRNRFAEGNAGYSIGNNSYNNDNGNDTHNKAFFFYYGITFP